MAQQTTKTLDQLFRTSDRETAKMRGVFFKLTEADRVLLQRTARIAKCSQAGVLRVGLALVVRAVEAQVAAGDAP